VPTIALKQAENQRVNAYFQAFPRLAQEAPIAPRKSLVNHWIEKL